MLSVSPVLLLLLLAPGMARAGGTEAPEPQSSSAAADRGDNLGRPYAPSASDKSVNQGHAFALPQYQYTSAAGRDQPRHMMPMAGPPGGFYRGQLRQDKSSYRSSGFLTSSKSDPNLALGYSPRIPSPAVQDPLQNRLGGFNLPPSAAFQHRYFPTAGGLHQPVGGFNTKNPVGHNLQLIPPYQMRGSRVIDNISYKPRDPTKKTGVYVVPSPSKLYYDGVKQ